MFAVVGWLCAVGGTVLALPQFLRIMQSRSTAGVSLLAWQLWACIGTVWAVHGFVQHSLAMVIPNLFTAIFSGVILWLIYKDRRLTPIQLLTGPAVLILIGISLRLVFGPIAFSVFMLVPQAVAVLGQFFELVRCADLFGVSGGYFRASVAMQFLWLSYGILGHDVACTISSVMMIVLVSANLIVYSLRRTGRLAANPTFAAALTELMSLCVPRTLRV